jgi:site-specific recombinase XerD
MHSQAAEFFVHLSRQNLAERSITEYRKAMRYLFNYLDWQDAPPSEITTAQLKEYIASLEEKGLATKTIRTRLFIIKRFFGFLVDKDYIEKSPAESIPPPKWTRPLPEVLTISQVRALFDAMRGGSVARRDLLLFYLIYICGLWVNEAVRLKVEDVDFADGILRVRGSRARNIPLHPATTRLLEEYVAERQPQGYLFPGRDGKPLTGRNVEMRFKQYAQMFLSNENRAI